jgi:putative transposase
MSSTHLSLHCHVIFGTKHQRRLIAPAWRPRFHAYLGGAIRTLDVVPEAVGGIEDHVHLLIGFRATHRLADIMRDVKRTSSAWVHDTIGEREFEWQDGYGAFSVSASVLEKVRHYMPARKNIIARKPFAKSTSNS